MKHIQHIIIGAALISLASSALASTYTNAWDVDLARNPPVLCDVWRGESIALTARTGLSSLPAAAEFYWQSPDMGDAWWSTNAVASATGDITVDWGPAMDSNASAYLFFFRAGNIYRPRGTIKMHGSPGAIPNELAPPVRTIDFATVLVTNAPWATPADLDAAIEGIVTEESDPVALPIAQDALSKANAAQAEAEAKVPMVAGIALAERFEVEGGWSGSYKSILSGYDLILGMVPFSSSDKTIRISAEDIYQPGRFRASWPENDERAPYPNLATVADIADAVSSIDVDEEDPYALHKAGDTMSGLLILAPAGIALYGAGTTTNFILRAEYDGTNINFNVYEVAR